MDSTIHTIRLGILEKDKDLKTEVNYNWSEEFAQQSVDFKVYLREILLEKFTQMLDVHLNNSIQQLK